MGCLEEKVAQLREDILENQAELMNKHYRKTEDSMYRVVLHSETGEFDTFYEYADTLPEAEEVLKGYKEESTARAIKDSEMWIEAWDHTFKDWLEIEH